ncbi:hypothetical protein BRADI_2g62094v3 [Brachypodium distachyon]|uniref:F-box domain-containing protein n=1 Tax=Brachypodium distachyon TaxID=15368 RepID=A0A0Q3N4X9_BRADI|nr:hypothetical protein BRADI_2g62094v3 [Brachypodium distachyon]
MLLEILVRFKDDAAALFKCAMVCKRWRRLVADPYFLRRCWPEPSSLSGFFTNKLRDGQGPSLVPTPGSLLGGALGIRALESFVPGAAAGLLDRAVPLACHHGLLLVRLAPHDVVVRLAVCNLLTGTCHVLPPLNPARKLEAHRKAGYAILQSAAGAGWSTPPAGSHFDREDVGGEHDYRAPFVQGDAVVGHGTAHWLFLDWGASCFRTIQVDAETGHVSSTKLPPLPMSYIMGRPCLGVDGALSLLWMRRWSNPHPRLEIWAQQDGHTNNESAGDQTEAPKKWLRTVELRLPEKEEVDGGMYALGEKCGKLLVTDSRCRVYAVDLGTGAMEEVADWPRHPRRCRAF